MNAQPEPTVNEDDPRLLQAVKEYLAELEAGRPPDRQAFEAQYPELKDALSPYLDALAAMHAAATLLQDPTGVRPAAATGAAIAAEPLGDFRIIREIGRGGMGNVYEAIQLSLGRRVALKVLPFAAALDGRQLQRFKNEAQAAAQLHHPHIVPVYYVGCERGVHFYAMQLIDGQNLAGLIDDLRRQESSWPATTLDKGSGTVPRPDAAAETRSLLGAELNTQRSERSGDFYRNMARLARQAAEALEHAHSVGIVHRDIKPGNLLVDTQGKLWITDFGLAQFHTDAGLTQTGDLLGTLRYMSPEQAGGRRALIDHRADVYSLGATLYELLTLRPIFSGSDWQSILDLILREEPVPPRALDPELPVELETIVLKAVSKMPAERYATAQELADDLQRFLEDRPILARRPTLVEKATKWARRHRGVVGSAVAALLILLAGLTLATVLTAQAYVESERQRDRAEENFRQARRAVDQFTQISAEEMAGNPMFEGPRRKLLEVALVYYQDFIDQHKDSPAIQAELVASRARVQAILNELTYLMGAYKYSLLQIPGVQVELQLSGTQRVELARIEGRLHVAFREAARFPPAEQEKLHLAVSREQEAEVLKILEPEQLKRFKQLVIQLRGPFAFDDAEVAAALALTTEQRQRARAIVVDAGLGQHGFNIAPPQNGPPKFGPPRDDGPKPWPPDLKGEPKHKDVRFPGPPMGRPPGVDARNWQRAREQLLEILTPEQKKKWDELTGAPFRGEMRFGPPPPPPVDHNR
ncbi:MAG: serine/threonine protein kinase [Gemmataceae bacterium]